MSIYHIYVEWDIGVSKKQFSVNKKERKSCSARCQLAQNDLFLSFLSPRCSSSIFSWEESFGAAHAAC